MSLLKLVAGVAAGMSLAVLLRSAVFAAGVLIVIGVMLQVAFAHQLNRYLHGADPVRMGARSFGQLTALVPVPVGVRALDFGAKASLWGAAVAVLQVIGWLRFT